jgi:nitric oxide reductase large subunit
LATLPLLLGAHQIIEAFVWFGLQGHEPHDVERVALWAYLLIAFVVLPIFVPLAVVINEPSRGRQIIMAPLVALGLAVSSILFAAMLHGPVNVKLRPTISRIPSISTTERSSSSSMSLPSAARCSCPPAAAS